SIYYYYEEKIWEAQKYNKRGLLEKARFANGITKEYLYNEYGALTTVNAMHGNTTYFSSHIELDDIGNVYEKSSSYYDGNGGTQAFVETFEYTDDLNRLNKRTLAMTQGALANSFTQNFDYEYDAAGNIKHKSDKGHYKYTHDDPSKTDLPNQLVSIHSDASLSEASKLLSFAYDDNGNTLADGERTFTYTPFNKPSRITKGGNVVNITYGIDRQILRKTHKRMENGQLVITTHTYIDGYERIEKSTGNQITEHKFTEANGNVVFTFRQSTTSQSISNRRDEHYIIKDVQGSVAMVTDWDASVVSQYLYTPFGEQIQLLQSSVLDGIAYQPTTERGYTGHHEMGSVGITHMGGRIYDASIGRFLQADPFVQAPNNAQNYNRYSYVMNNPMSYTDPSGYFFKAIGRFFKGALKAIANIPIINLAAQAAACYFGGPWGCAAYSAASTYSVTGSLGAAFRSAAVTYATAQAFGQVGKSFDGTGFYAKNGVGHIGAHALVGGVMSDLQGGKFGHGFISAGVSALAGGAFGKTPVGRVIGSAVVGGTISKITGGKFANGAFTAAFAAALRADWGTQADTSASAPGGGSGDFDNAKNELLKRGLITDESVKDLVDKTDTAALLPRTIDVSKLTDDDFKFVSSWDEATELVNTGAWQHVDGTHSGGKMTIYMSAGKPSYSIWLSGPAASGFGRGVKLTGYQNMIETIHHEYMHYSGVSNHLDASSRVSWGMRVRDDLGDWIRDM
ncbi:RHS repeat domain-containing protein, partial [Glaciecola siphonariae]